VFYQMQQILAEFLQKKLCLKEHTIPNIQDYDC